MKQPQALGCWICLQFVIVSSLLPNAAQAGEAVIVGATPLQVRFLTCVAQLSAGDLRDTPNSDETLTVVILEHHKFLEMRGLSCTQDKTCLLQLAGQANLSFGPYVFGLRDAATVHYP